MLSLRLKKEIYYILQIIIVLRIRLISQILELIFLL